ncbi:MAG: hypothetical protein GWO87_03310 [Xanthomonadaceae bacterium]|nr:hypothetical protein [Rhodospirillaceae bacterium]NIA18189.1 hypothetical protein [Xanthomonadaceae bacterium]
MSFQLLFVIPAKAGIPKNKLTYEIPAFAGMTLIKYCFYGMTLIKYCF